MIATPSSGYYEVTYTCDCTTSTTSLGTVYVTIYVDSAKLQEQLSAAELKFREIGDELYEQAAKKLAERPEAPPKPTPTPILRLQGRRRPVPTQLPSTFG